MRGSDQRNGSLVSYVNLEERIPARHPLRKMLAIVNDALAALDAEFAGLHAVDGPPFTAPEFPHTRFELPNPGCADDVFVRSHGAPPPHLPTACAIETEDWRQLWRLACVPAPKNVPPDVIAPVNQHGFRSPQ